MATETTNLHLVKPDKEEYYDVDIGNDNWDKIDANAAEVDTALGGKAAVQYSAYTNLNDLLTVPSGFYNITPPATGMPMNGYWFCIVCAELPNLGTRIIYAMPVGIGNDSLWKIRCTGGVPETWKEMATATPPTEYDLPLASDVSEMFPGEVACIFRKNQFSEVHVIADLALATPGGENTFTTVAVLPSGYRPKKQVRKEATVLDDSGAYPAIVGVFTNGEIKIHAGRTYTQALFEVDFQAGN